MSDTYTPDEEQVREQYTREQPPQIGSVAEKSAEFDRFIARVKAEALRDARDNVRASSFWADGSDNYADRVRGYLGREAERIEKEANDE